MTIKDDYVDKVDYLVKKLKLEFLDLCKKLNLESELQKSVVLLDVSGKLQRVATSDLSNLIK